MSESREAMLERLRAKLTPKQAAFAEEYARSGNAERSAVSAGYADSPARGAQVQSRDNLSNPLVVAYLAELTRPTRQKRIADAEQLAEHLTKIALGEHRTEQALGTRDGVEIVEVLPSHAEQVKAAETLAKIRGYLAPIKLDVTVEVRDGVTAWLGAFLTDLQAETGADDSVIERVLQRHAALKLGRQTVKVIDMEGS